MARRILIAGAPLLAILSFASNVLAQSVQHPPANEPDPLRAFLQKYLGKPYPAFEQEGATRYSSAFVDLNDDGAKEVIVYLSGRGWCGSGGCVMLILSPEAGSYRVITKATVTRLPIRVLGTKSNGWHDLSVEVAGGGIQQGYPAELSFNGKTYPENPTVPPAHPLSEKVQGKTVISESTKDQSLY